MFDKQLLDTADNIDYATKVLEERGIQISGSFKSFLESF